MTSRTAEGDGLKLHYLTAGDGPTVILLHGYAETSRMETKARAPRAEIAFDPFHVVKLANELQRSPGLTGEIDAVSVVDRAQRIGPARPRWYP